MMRSYIMLLIPLLWVMTIARPLGNDIANSVQLEKSANLQLLQSRIHCLEISNGPDHCFAYQNKNRLFHKRATAIVVSSNDKTKEELSAFVQKLKNSVTFPSQNYSSFDFEKQRLHEQLMNLTSMVENSSIKTVDMVSHLKYTKEVFEIVKDFSRLDGYTNSASFGNPNLIPSIIELNAKVLASRDLDGESSYPVGENEPQLISCLQFLRSVKSMLNDELSKSSKHNYSTQTFLKFQVARAELIIRELLNE